MQQEQAYIYPISIARSEAALEMVIAIYLDVNDGECRSCAGSGVSQSPPPQTCPLCDGTGQKVGGGDELLSLFNHCSRCGGKGFINPTPCLTCNGTGARLRKQDMKVVIPACPSGGMRLRFTRDHIRRLTGDGNWPSDVSIEVNISDNDLIERNYEIISIRRDESSREQESRTNLNIDAEQGDYSGEQPFEGLYGEPEPRYEEMLEATCPEMYCNNPFRLLGVSIHATERDLKREFEKMEMAEKFGGGVSIGGPLALATPPDKHTLREASQRLRNPSRRIIDELFWLWPLSAGNDSVLAALIAGNEEAAINQWREMHSNRVDNGIGLHNLAVFHHTKALDAELNGKSASFEHHSHWNEAFDCWRSLIEDEAFWEQLEQRCEQMDDPRLTRYTAVEMRSTLPLALLKISTTLASVAAQRGDTERAERHMKLILRSGFEQKIIEEALREATKPLRERIHTLCDSAQEETNASNEEGDQATLRLIEQTKGSLMALDLLLPQESGLTDLQQDAHDYVAQTALQCNALYADHTKDYKTLLDRIRTISPIAESQAAREKLKETSDIARSIMEQVVCWFCERTDGTQASAVGVMMYVMTGEKTSSYTTVSVPRCDSCGSAHKRKKRFTLLGFSAGFAVSVLLSLSINALAGMQAINTGLFLGVLALLLVVYVVGRYVSLGCLFFAGMMGIGLIVNLAAKIGTNTDGALEMLIITTICTMVGFDIGRRYGMVGAQKAIKPEKEKKSHPLIIRQINNGWEFGSGPSQ